jgi:hypothetical protein
VAAARQQYQAAVAAVGQARAQVASGRDQAAAAQAGVQLDESDHQTLRDIGVHEMDEAELVARVSKRDTNAC